MAEITPGGATAPGGSISTLETVLPTSRDRLSSDDGPVGVADDKSEALRGCRIDPALHPQELASLLDALAEPSRHVRERRDNDVADAVAPEVAPSLEAVVEDLGELSAVGEGDQAVPHVAGRRHPEFLPEPSARAPVVGDRYDRGKVPVYQNVQGECVRRSTTIYRLYVVDPAYFASCLYRLDHERRYDILRPGELMHFVRESTQALGRP
jgi:hypothetical protein